MSSTGTPKTKMSGWPMSSLRTVSGASESRGGKKPRGASGAAPDCKAHHPSVQGRMALAILVFPRNQTMHKATMAITARSHVSGASDATAESKLGWSFREGMELVQPEHRPASGGTPHLERTELAMHCNVRFGSPAGLARADRLHVVQQHFHVCSITISSRLSCSPKVQGSTLDTSILRLGALDPAQEVRLLIRRRVRLGLPGLDWRPGRVPSRGQAKLWVASPCRQNFLRSLPWTNSAW